MEEEKYKKYSIPEVGIKFQYPAWWQQTMEMGNTHLFLDEHLGAFRITPFSGTFKEEGFLQNRFDEYTDNGIGPEWKKYNNRLYLYYEDAFDNTKEHHYTTTAKELIVICCFSYGKELLDNEVSKAKVAGAMAEVEKLLSGLTIEE